MADDPDALPAELVEIWRLLDDPHRASLLRVARALTAAAQEEKEAGERIIEQDGGGWGVG